MPQSAKTAAMLPSASPNAGKGNQQCLSPLSEPRFFIVSKQFFHRPAQPAFPDAHPAGLQWNLLWDRYEHLFRRICDMPHRTIKSTATDRAPYVLEPGDAFDPVRHFFLHHNRNAVRRNPFFQQFHDDRRRDVVRQIDNPNLARSAVFSTTSERSVFRDIRIDNLHIIVIFQSFRQNRDQMAVNLPPLQRGMRIPPPPRSVRPFPGDFDHQILCADFRSFDNCVDNIFYPIKILPQTLECLKSCFARS